LIGFCRNLFWKLVALRAFPSDRRLSVLVHGGLDVCNLLFQYEDTFQPDPNGAATAAAAAPSPRPSSPSSSSSGDGRPKGRPICAKFLDFSRLSVSSPVTDISYFLHRSVHPEISGPHHAALLAHYHRSHTEAVEAFGMHGFELELETFLEEYKAKKEYGAITSCLLRVALYVLQSMSVRDGHAGGAPNGRNGGDDEEGDDTEVTSSSESLSTERLRVDRDLVPVDLRLRPHLAALAASCPCPCAMGGGGGGGSREVDVAELPADGLEDDIRRLQHNKKERDPSASGLKGLDCSNGGTTGAIKKLFTGLIRSKEVEDKATTSASSSAAPSAPPANGKAENGREQ